MQALDSVIPVVIYICHLIIRQSLVPCHAFYIAVSSGASACGLVGILRQFLYTFFFSLCIELRLFVRQTKMSLRCIFTSHCMPHSLGLALSSLS